MKRIIAIVLALASLVGCRKDSNEGQAESDITIAIIDGRPLTADYVRDVVRVRAKMLELAGNAMSGFALTNWLNTCAIQIIPGLISANLLENEIKRLGETPHDEDWAKTLEDYNNATRQSAKTIDELAAKFGEAAEEFRHQAKRSALFRAYKRLHSPKPATKEDLPEFYANLTNKLDMAKSVDAIAHSNAEKAWRRLEAGEDWAKVAEECSEDTLVDEANKEFASDWATVGLDGMGYQELAKALPDLKMGSWSRPVETDEGLLIVKVVDMAGDQRTLARMLFRMAQPVEIPEDEAAALNEIDRQRKEETEEGLLDSLREKAKIEYPLGETFSYTFWK